MNQKDDASPSVLNDDTKDDNQPIKTLTWTHPAIREQVKLGGDTLPKEPLTIRKTRRSKDVQLLGLTIGAPTKLTKDVAQRLIDLIASGKTLTKAAEMVGVNKVTVYRWSDENELFRNALTHARKHHADALVDESMELLEDTSRDIIDGPKGPVINNAQVHRDKARVELRLRLAGIYNPMFAEKKEGNTVNIQVNNSVDAPRQETRAEWLARHQASAPSVQAAPGTPNRDDS